MGMNFPLAGYEEISSLLNLIGALFLGMGFGFFLEQGGLGDSKKLIDQFLLKDLAVFKVMFMAIITAMVGLYFFNLFGIVNLDLIVHSDSYIIPQITGGLILGAGFMVGAYCPGTCIVGISSGKLDALWFVGGLALGTLVFSILFPIIESFYYSTKLDINSLYELLNINYGTLVFIVILIAIAGFYFSEKLEGKHE
jgi:hypothetical protein